MVAEDALAMFARKEEEWEAKIAKSEAKEAKTYALLLASDEEVLSLRAKEVTVQAREDDALALMASFRYFNKGPGSFRAFFRWNDLRKLVADLRQQVTDLRKQVTDLRQ